MLHTYHTACLLFKSLANQNQQRSPKHRVLSGTSQTVVSTCKWHIPTNYVRNVIQLQYKIERYCVLKETSPSNRQEFFCPF